MGIQLAKWMIYLFSFVLYLVINYLGYKLLGGIPHFQAHAHITLWIYAYNVSIISTPYSHSCWLSLTNVKNCQLDLLRFNLRKQISYSHFPSKKHQKQEHIFQSFMTQMLHVWNIYTNIGLQNDSNVGRYTIHGAYG